MRHFFVFVLGSPFNTLSFVIALKVLVVRRGTGSCYTLKGMIHQPYPPLPLHSKKKMGCFRGLWAPFCSLTLLLKSVAVDKEITTRLITAILRVLNFPHFHLQVENSHLYIGLLAHL